MAAAVPVEQLGAPPTFAARGVVHVLFENRKFVVGTTIFVLLLLVSLIEGRLMGLAGVALGAFPQSWGLASPGRCCWAALRLVRASSLS